jgi:hypothetical protein
MERDRDPESLPGMVLHAFQRSLAGDPLVTLVWVLLASTGGVLAGLLVAIVRELAGRL